MVGGGPMKVLGIDPGKTTGFCLYDTTARRVLAWGEFPGHDGHVPLSYDECVMERPKGYGPTRPDVVDAAYVAGRLVERLRWHRRDLGEGAGVPYPIDVHELTRLDVSKLLSDATHGAVRVKNDATAWAALVLLHGEGSDKKPRRKKGEIVEPGGALGEVTGHARAALAVAVAWTLQPAAKET